MEQSEYLTLEETYQLAEENRQLLRQEVAQQKEEDCKAGIDPNSHFTARQILNRLLGSQMGKDLSDYHAAYDYGRETRYRPLTPEEVDRCFFDPSSRDSLIKIYEIVRDSILKSEIESIDKIDFKQLFFMRFAHKKVYSWLRKNEEVLSPILWAMGREFPSLPQKSIFKKPPTHWRQVKFCVLKDMGMEISVRGEIFSREDLLAKKVLSRYLLKLLYHIVAHGKPFDSRTLGADICSREYIKRLRERLMEIFEINDNPIAYNKKAEQYVPQFKHERDNRLVSPIL